MLIAVTQWNMRQFDCQIRQAGDMAVSTQPAHPPAASRFTGWPEASPGAGPRNRWRDRVARWKKPPGVMAAAAQTPRAKQKGARSEDLTP
jgi:hypothetical protein